MRGFEVEAIEEYKKAINKDPAYVEPYENCSKAYYAVGNYDMAQYYRMKAKDILEAKASVIRGSEIDEEEGLCVEDMVGVLDQCGPGGGGED